MNSKLREEITRGTRKCIKFNYIEILVMVDITKFTIER